MKRLQDDQRVGSSIGGEPPRERAVAGFRNRDVARKALRLHGRVEEPLKGRGRKDLLSRSPCRRTRGKGFLRTEDDLARFFDNYIDRIAKMVLINRRMSSSLEILRPRRIIQLRPQSDEKRVRKLDEVQVRAPHGASPENEIRDPAENHDYQGKHARVP